MSVFDLVRDIASLALFVILGAPLFIVTVVAMAVSGSTEDEPDTEDLRSGDRAGHPAYA